MRQKQKNNFSLRLRVVGGNLTAKQLAKIAEVSENYGDGYVHLTSRQSVEIPFVKLDDVEAVKDALAEGDVEPGVCGPRVRTITACQGEAICPGGCIDTYALAKDNRRTNHEYRECNVTFLCVLLSGTPAQIKPLIPSAENGLFSRQLFYYMPAIEEWEDQFNEADTDYDSRFLEWGAQWKEVLDAITASVSNINMKLTHEQKEIFNFHFARVFGRASAIHGNQMKSAVTRIAINIFRIISIIALLRSLESLLPGGERSGEPQENIVRTLLDCPGLTPSGHIPQENIADGIVPQFNLSIRTDDFYAVLALVEPLYRHACHILSLLPAGTPTAPSANMTPETLFDCLPLRFTRNEAIDKGEQVGVPAGSVDSLLKRMTERGQLVKVGRGEYEFNARMHTRTCVGVRESASSASLQDS